MNIKLFSFFLLLLVSIQLYPATVAVHDPSVVIVYKDATGNSYPENDATKTRTKYYYIFGTQLGAAYSTDMINWTAFTPSFSVNGTVSTNYLQVFNQAAQWSKHTTTAKLKENLWAPDIIFNKSMNKWCLYFSVNGDDWLSSIVLHTASKIEGPYEYAGTVVYSGMNHNSSGAGNTEYTKVTGQATVANRYLNVGNWKGEYGSSCIDPNVLYDKDGKLWLVYGSWSGGIFLLKLNEQNGLRNYSHNYGFTNFAADGAVWDGTRLRYDPYMGIHIAGGYYVSGEGAYVCYLTDKSGIGYYYMFISMGFYSPEGGYTMRVFRSATLDGIYKDITGDDAVFNRYILNYGNNTQYGFPIMQNFKYNWWNTAQIAQGHNSVLCDDDGNTYLIYHTKQDNGTIWHNVEVHQLFFNERGWFVAAPFEYRKGFALSTKTYTTEEIAGQYGIITHNTVDYVNLKSNTEQQIYLNADRSITGAYTGTWIYDFANGSQYLTLITNAGTFQAVVCEQLMDGLSTHTIGFTGVNAANERALWGYHYPKTQVANSVIHRGSSLTVGYAAYSLAWNDYNSFLKHTASGDFMHEYTFVNYTQAAENWHNWAIALTANNQTWYMRADAYSNSTFTGSTVGYKYNWDWANFKDIYQNKEVRVRVLRQGTTINVFAYIGEELIYTSTATNCPTTAMDVYLGGEKCYLDVKKVTTANLENRNTVGTTTEYGTYPSAFNTAQSKQTIVSGNFELNYQFNNYRNQTSNDNWDNYIISATAANQTMLLRADAYAVNPQGTLAYTYDWDWTIFTKLMSGAKVDLNIKRTDNTIAYNAVITDTTGAIYHYTTLNTNAPTGDMQFGFTSEESMLDIFKTETITYSGTDIQNITQTIELQKGWNLISINIIPDMSNCRDAQPCVSTATPTVFAGLDVQEIKTMDAYWKKANLNFLNTLKTIEPGNGYLVNMNNAGTLSVTGVPVEARLIAPLQSAGWHLIGCPFQTPTSFSNHFNSTNCETIKNFDGFWIPNGTNNSIQNLEPGKAYFIK
ncbi:MAG: glycoside hydrolase family 43 protein [Bacteroidales bacterium]|nr:glycoside hydrolase family 43 protein [Bacteroidales bacterium]